MEVSVIIAICSILLIAYLFDLTSSKSKIPSVILLLALGFSLKIASNFFGLDIPDLSPALPILGMSGLVLIVLEGSLELELNKSKIGLITKSVFISLIPMLALAFAIAYAFDHLGYASLKDSLTNAIPLCVISSAIAIPSSKNLSHNDREFITYDSSLSDIFGVIFFNFITLNDVIDAESYGKFGLEILIMLTISFIATISLAWFLSKIKHHIKFGPIILLVILIFSISKYYHLPSLIFILLFGLFLRNINKLQASKFIQQFNPISLQREIVKFQDLNQEFVFLIKALFFIVFGFLIEMNEIINLETLPWALAIVGAGFIIRLITLVIFRVNLLPAVFIAPRGLITILLFLSIPIEQKIPLVNNSLVIQVVLLTTVLMMFGTIFSSNKKTEKANLIDTPEEA